MSQRGPPDLFHAPLVHCLELIDFLNFSSCSRACPRSRVTATRDTDSFSPF
ncbi:MAG: hypothetical protein Q8P67_04885 [archaeon]|nr:hypothetical protein [archaeon]